MNRQDRRKAKAQHDALTKWQVWRWKIIYHKLTDQERATVPKRWPKQCFLCNRETDAQTFLCLIPRSDVLQIRLSAICADCADQPNLEERCKQDIQQTFGSLARIISDDDRPTAMDVLH